MQVNGSEYLCNKEKIMNIKLDDLNDDDDDDDDDNVNNEIYENDDTTFHNSDQLIKDKYSNLSKTQLLYIVVHNIIFKNCLQDSNYIINIDGDEQIIVYNKKNLEEQQIISLNIIEFTYDELYKHITVELILYGIIYECNEYNVNNFLIKYPNKFDFLLSSFDRYSNLTIYSYHLLALAKFFIVLKKTPVISFFDCKKTFSIYEINKKNNQYFEENFKIYICNKYSDYQLDLFTKFYLYSNKTKKEDNKSKLEKIQEIINELKQHTTKYIYDLKDEVVVIYKKISAQILLYIDCKSIVNIYDELFLYIYNELLEYNMVEPSIFYKKYLLSIINDNKEKESYIHRNICVKYGYQTRWVFVDFILYSIFHNSNSIIYKMEQPNFYILQYENITYTVKNKYIININNYEKYGNYKYYYNKIINELEILEILPKDYIKT